MKKYKAIWILGIVAISAVALFFLIKGIKIEVPSMGSENWFEVSSMKQKCIIGGITGLIIGNIGFSIIYFALMFAFNKEFKSQVVNWSLNRQKKFINSIDEKQMENYKENIQAMANVAFNAVNKETKEVVKIKCPHCQALNEEDAQFCNKCGAKL